jgi:parallel beta-helix repeat protein
MYGNKQGLLIGPQAKECVVEDCDLYDNESCGIFVTNCASDVIIKGNRVNDNDELGISVTQNSNVSIL